jgi:hypothetical protein
LLNKFIQIQGFWVARVYLGSFHTTWKKIETISDFVAKAGARAMDVIFAHAWKGLC